MLDYPTRLLKSLTGVLSNLEKQVRAKAESERAEKSSGRASLASKVRVEVILQEEITNFYKAENNERPSKAFWDRFRFWLEIGGVIVALILAWLNYGALCEIRKQTEAIQETARAAADANFLTSESLRGRIRIKNISLRFPITAGSKVSISVETENVGHATAFETATYTAEEREGLPTGNVPIDTQDGTTVLEPGQEGLFAIQYREPLPQSAIDNLNSRPKKIFFFGRITYITLGRKHRTEFCAYLTRFSDSAFEAPETEATRGFKNGRPFALMRCPGSNWSDAN